ncbi:MAG: ComEC/Rec2 family competence protein, partial [Faecalibacterium sp.]|nr:ComEC/Rec2 family competence protein [Faecalibacterium sp.]
MVPLVLVLAVLIGTVLFAISELRLRVPVQSLQDKTLRITAVVAQTEPSYEDGMVNAVLLVDSAGDKQNDFRVACAALPQCRRGDVIEAVVTFSPVEGKTDRLRAYADGEFLQAEYRSGFQRTGQRWPLSLRLRQLGEECSDRLRRYLAPEEGAVLAAMVAGDNRFLSSRQSEVYRKAGVSHILVVSGLHLTLLCGLIPTPQRMTRRIRVVRAL